MKEQSVVFDQCRTADDIHAQLQHLLKELLAAIQKTPGDSLCALRLRSGQAKTGVNEHVNLRVLSELSYADLKQYEHPVFFLSEICRLLVKLGDRQSLMYCLALAHTIYAFQCKHNESWYISYLYKGIAQIGLNFVDLGVKNVLIGISEHPDFSIVAVDEALGYWALMSASVLKKNLKLAITFAEQWHNAAQEDNLDGEVFRASMVMQLFHLLLSDKAACLQEIENLVSNAPTEWQDTVNFLAGWTQAMTEGRGAETPVRSPVRSEVEGEVERTTFSEPYPLFLGVTWCSPPHPDPLPRGEREYGANDFRFLCKIRRTQCYKDNTKPLSIEEIKQYANLMIQWELPRPLYEFETALKSKDREVYVHHAMTRLLGKSVLERVLGETIEPDVVTQNDAIILVMDVRRYSALSEQRTPKELFNILNPIFKIMSEELEQAGGTILDFVGDCIIIVFNTFKDQQTDITEILSHTTQCLHRIYVLNALSLQTGLPEIQIGVGIHKGPVSVGYLGGLARCHLTMLGNTINLASRLETASKKLPGDVIVSASCFDNDPPDIWSAPLNVTFSIRDLGPYTEMKNISQPVHVFGVSPLSRYWVDFVPMGFVACPEKGVVYIDTGNACESGIIDHHARPETNSSCELLVRKPELLLDHIRDTPASQIGFRFHELPDLDCITSFYAACELMETNPRRDLLEKLAEYVSKACQARVPQPEKMSASLYGIYKAHELIVKKKYGAGLTNFLLLEAGMRVVDAAMYLMEHHQAAGDFASIFQYQPGWFSEEKRLIEEDRARYQEDLEFRSHTYLACVNSIPEPVTGLWVDHPQSVFFRIWGWNDPKAPGGQGYQFLALDFSKPGKNRFVIGVDPESGTDVNELGQLMEQHETMKRKKLGKERPIHPIRYPADNSDPWYFGQGHNYAVIDSPGQGTVLTAEEVQQIHESWQNKNDKDFTYIDVQKNSYTGMCDAL